ncbi:uncharacterized protein TRIADDRAFT_57816 [Trichoplax adhaerens]|uniref:Uncharacterized protein n=1 Tax=Trichoplax adhaerens TaxID=10228 RepID=B3S1F9_TRIAD|nr:predicted protein [Trichoplax adhaerens]EDV23319.1 predicted protein [Trichoplax adhaerens]|eukprot:XP_002114229.1 predicted protein [Trichoplax adhaerens]
MPSGHYETDINSSTVFNCTVYNWSSETDKVIKLYWRKSYPPNTVSVKNHTGNKHSNITTQLLFNQITSEDAGDYYCTATDKNNNIRAETQLVQLVVRGSNYYGETRVCSKRLNASKEAVPLSPVINKVITDSESHSVNIEWHNPYTDALNEALIAGYRVCYREIYPIIEQVRERKCIAVNEVESRSIILTKQMRYGANYEVNVAAIGKNGKQSALSKSKYVYFPEAEPEGKPLKLHFLCNPQDEYNILYNCHLSWEFPINQTNGNLTRTYITITERDTDFITSYTFNDGSLRQFSLFNISVEEPYLVQIIMANAVGNSSVAESILTVEPPDIEPTLGITDGYYGATDSQTGTPDQQPNMIDINVVIVAVVLVLSVVILLVSVKIYQVMERKNRMKLSKYIFLGCCFYKNKSTIPEPLVDQGLRPLPPAPCQAEYYEDFDYDELNNIDDNKPENETPGSTYEVLPSFKNKIVMPSTISLDLDNMSSRNSQNHHLAQLKGKDEGTSTLGYGQELCLQMSTISAFDTSTFSGHSSEDYPQIFSCRYDTYKTYESTV